MNEETLLLRINYLCKRLGPMSQLAFRKESLDEIVVELERLDKILIYSVK